MAITSIDQNVGQEDNPGRRVGHRSAFVGDGCEWKRRRQNRNTAVVMVRISRKLEIIEPGLGLGLTVDKNQVVNSLQTNRARAVKTSQDVAPCNLQ